MSNHCQYFSDGRCKVVERETELLLVKTELRAIACDQCFSTTSPVDGSVNKVIATLGMRSLFYDLASKVPPEKLGQALRAFREDPRYKKLHPIAVAQEGG